MRPSKGSPWLAFLWRPRLVAAALLCALFFTWGFFVHRDKIFPYGAVRRLIYWSTWHRLNPERSWGEARSAAPEPADAARTALPYLSGYRPASGAKGVTIHDRDRAYPGLNLYISGHDTAAFLIDMKGTVLHRWRLDPIQAWDRHAPPASASLVYPEWGYWRRAFPFPDGGLLVIYESAGLLRLDAGSEVLWSFWGGCHHDLFVTPGERIYVLGKERVDSEELGRPVINDRIYALDGSGRVLLDLSVLEALLDSDYAPILDALPGDGIDIFHSNTLQVFDGSLEKVHPAFRAGNILTSLRSLNTVAVIDPEQRKVVWALSGRWRWQHDPQLLPGGSMLLFNNRLGPGRSQLLEIDPLRQLTLWSYEVPGFHSDILGAVQRLPNGNTLATESTHGRAFEVTGEGEIVWEFHSPHRSGEGDELIATLFDLSRWDRGYFDFLGR